MTVMMTIFQQWNKIIYTLAYMNNEQLCQGLDSIVREQLFTTPSTLLASASMEMALKLNRVKLLWLILI